MSRPKIGSVTEAVVENGSRFCQSSTVSQAVASEPATPSAKRTTSPASTHVAIGLRSGMSSAVQAVRVERRSSGGLQRRAPPVRRTSAASAASLSRSNRLRIVPPPGIGGGVRRPASHRLPSSTTSASTSPNTNSPTCAAKRVQYTSA